MEKIEIGWKVTTHRTEPGTIAPWAWILAATMYNKLISIIKTNDDSRTLRPVAIMMVERTQISAYGPGQISPQH